jgi:hypothetical protein
MSYACPSEALREGGSWGMGVGVGVWVTSWPQYLLDIFLKDHFTFEFVISLLTTTILSIAFRKSTQMPFILRNFEPVL